MIEELPWEAARRIVRMALEEDIGTGDVTSRWVLPRGHRSNARIVAKQEGVLCGTGLVSVVFEELAALDPEAEAGQVTWTHLRRDGDEIVPGLDVLALSGPTRAILEGERVLLNFVQHLSGVATQARIHQRAAGPSCRVLDTRKTTPGQRALEKWAIRAGGGSNHRQGLWDAVLIKENHAQAAGGVRAAAEAALARKPPEMDLIVEVRSLEELESIVDLPLTRVLLDNFTPETTRRAVALVRERDARFGLESSGGIRLETLPGYAAAGARYASLGALTHSALPLDLSLLLEGT
jgi:nicotinate-nucleotide pyrophosphorylase (carboxylating)